MMISSLYETKKGVMRYNDAWSHDMLLWLVDEMKTYLKS